MSAYNLDIEQKATDANYDFHSFMDFDKVVDNLKESFIFNTESSIYDEVIDEVKSYVYEYEEYGLKKPLDNSVKYCLQFLETVKERYGNELFAPNPCVHPDRQVALTWQTQLVGIITLSFSKDGIVYYGSYFEIEGKEERYKGKPRLNDENIELVYNLLEKFII